MEVEGIIDLNKEDFLLFFKDHSVKDCAEYYSVSKPNILAYMKYYNIPQHTRKEIGLINSLKQKNKIDINELIDFYITKNNIRKNTAIHFNVSESLIKKICRLNNIKKDYNSSYENTKKTLIEKYGTSNLMEISVDKREKTFNERYGVSKSFQSKSIQAKVVDSKILKNDYSEMEFYVGLYLNNHKINHSREFKIFDDYFMPFDFAIFVNNETRFIECDGFFHKDREERDNRKTIYCKNNNIPLLRVSSEEEFEEKIEEFLK